MSTSLASLASEPCFKNCREQGLVWCCLFAACIVGFALFRLIFSHITYLTSYHWTFPTRPSADAVTQCAVPAPPKKGSTTSGYCPLRYHHINRRSQTGHKKIPRSCAGCEKIGFKGENRNESYLEAKKRVVFYNFCQITSPKISSLPTL